MEERPLCIEATIELLVAILDAMDGDCDPEPDSDGEPWRGWNDVTNQTSLNGADMGDGRKDDDGREAEPTEGGIGDIDALALCSPFFVG